MTKEKDMMLPPKKRAVSYEDSPNGLDLTTDASRQSSAATSAPPVAARSPPQASSRSPGPIDLKVKDDRHSNVSPPGRLYLENRMASRKSSDPQPTLNFTANIQIKEDKDDVPIKTTIDSGLIKVKDEPLSEEPLRTLTPPTADAYFEQQLRLRQLETRGGKLPLTLQHLSQFTPQTLNYIAYVNGVTALRPPSPHHHLPRPPSPHHHLSRPPPTAVQLDIGQIRYPISGHPAADLSHHHLKLHTLPLLTASALQSQASAAVGLPPSRHLLPDVSLHPVKPEAVRSAVKTTAGAVLFNHIQNQSDMSDEKRPRARSPFEAINRINYSSFDLNRSRDSFSIENSRDSYSRENGRDSYSRENGRESYSREYDDDSCNSEDDVDVGGTPEPRLSLGGLSKQHQFMDEKNIHNYARGERSNSFEGGRKNSKDLKRACDHGMGHLFQDLISLPHEEFTEMCEGHKLNKQQIDLAREFRRRGKNKVAAQNCRKRKMNQVTELTGKVEDAKRKAAELERMDQESAKLLDAEKAKLEMVININMEQGFKMYCIQCDKCVKNGDECPFIHQIELKP